MFQSPVSAELHSDWMAAPEPQLLLTWQGTCLPETEGIPKLLCGLSQPGPFTNSLTSQS